MLQPRIVIHRSVYSTTCDDQQIAQSTNRHVQLGYLAAGRRAADLTRQYHSWVSKLSVWLSVADLRPWSFAIHYLDGRQLATCVYCIFRNSRGRSGPACCHLAAVFLDDRFPPARWCGLSTLTAGILLVRRPQDAGRGGRGQDSRMSWTAVAAAVAAAMTFEESRWSVCADRPGCDPG
jgi:hypothetical protein